jgi:prepilin signal peptidase PulO-like enzyme (type II secretory pathway)
MMCDSRTGRIPDLLTIPALIGVLGYSLVFQHSLDPLIGAGIIFGVFAITAWQTKGLGMGWGDVYLLTLAGAVFGVRVGIFGAILACLLTVIVTGFRRRTKDPVAFAPFVVAAFGLLSTFAL